MALTLKHISQHIQFIPSLLQRVPTQRQLTHCEPHLEPHVHSRRPAVGGWLPWVRQTDATCSEVAPRARRSARGDICSFAGGTSPAAARAPGRTSGRHGTTAAAHQRGPTAHSPGVEWHHSREGAVGQWRRLRGARAQRAHRVRSLVHCTSSSLHLFLSSLISSQDSQAAGARFDGLSFTLSLSSTSTLHIHLHASPPPPFHLASPRLTSPHPTSPLLDRRTCTPCSTAPTRVQTATWFCTTRRLRGCPLRTRRG